MSEGFANGGFSESGDGFANGGFGESSPRANSFVPSDRQRSSSSHEKRSKHGGEEPRRGRSVLGRILRGGRGQGNAHGPRKDRESALGVTAAEYFEKHRLRPLKWLKWPCLYAEGGIVGSSKRSRALQKKGHVPWRVGEVHSDWLALEDLHWTTQSKLDEDYDGAPVNREMAARKEPIDGTATDAEQCSSLPRRIWGQSPLRSPSHSSIPNNDTITSYRRAEKPSGDEIRRLKAELEHVRPGERGRNAAQCLAALYIKFGRNYRGVPKNGRAATREHFPEWERWVSIEEAVVPLTIGNVPVGRTIGGQKIGR
ncbi:hypothetical protein niasHS_012866 [Heterodera schachtii]|uniref:Uncharacterized protein n=1 Tax=Heterodera schachtii TaxID=97005 RepID=A0ABD2I3S0_HETSC